MFRTVDPGASTMVQSYEHRQLLHRARRYIYIKGAVNAVIAFLFLLTFPLELKPKMVAIALTDALFLVPYWFLVQRYPTLATGLSVGITSLAISAGDWVGGYQTGASGILYGLLILGGHLVLIKPLSTYLISGLIIGIYVGTIALEVNGVIPINFPFTWSNLFRVVSLSVISMFGLTILTGVVTRLYRELLQRNKELLALNAVSAAASQSLDLDEVLQLALDKALEGMGMDLGGILLLDPSDGKLVLGAHRGGSPKSVRAFRGVTADEGLMPRMMECALVIDDLSEVTRDHQVMIEREGLQALASVPLKSVDVTLGVMVVSSYKPHTFTSQELELLSVIGNQVGVAIENARLYKAEQDRRRMAESLREMAGVIGSTLELNEVLQLVLEKLRRVLDYDSSTIMALEGDRFQVIAVEGFADREEVLQLSYTADEADISWEAIRTKQALVIADVTQDTRWTYEPQTADVRAWIGAPLIAKEEVIGLLTVDSYQVGKYSQDDAQLVMTFAQQAALAIKNAQLFREMKERFEETIALYQTSLDIPERKRAQEMLRIKDHTIASSITAIAIAEFAGNLVYVNPSFLKMWGYDEESEVLGKPAVEFWQMEEKAWAVVEALRDGDSFTGELMARRKDGSLFDVQLSASTVTDEAGRPICMMASFVDITERKQAEEALRKAHEELERRVEERTAELSKANVLLEWEIAQRRRTEEALERRATQLAVVNEVARRAASILDMDQLLREVVAAIQQGFDYYNVALSLLDEATGELEVQAIAGGFTDLVSPDYHQVVGMGMVGWVAETGQSLLANDVSQEPRYILGFLGEPLTKAELCVPLKLAGRVIGVLDVQDTQLNAFDETDLLAMETLVDQIAVAIENARLFEEAKRRFEETTALYQTSLDITAQLEMTEVLKSIVERAVTLLRAEGGGIYLYNPEREDLRWAITYGHAEKYVGTTLKPGEGLAGKVFQTGEPLIADDYRTREGRPPAYEADGPFTALLQVPLRWQDRVIGVLSISADMEKRTFNGDDIWLATLFANQAAVAIENARIYEEERKRVTQLELISGVIQKVTSILDLDELLSQVAHLIRDTFGYYNIGIHLVEADSNELILRAADGPLGEALIDSLRLKIGQEGIAGWVAHSGEPLLVNDVSREPRYYFVEESQDTRSQLAVPIKLKGEVVGVLDALSVELDAFSQDDVSILQTLADELAVAIENARLYEAKRLQLLQLEELAAASQEITADLDLASVLKEIGTQALTTLEADRAAIFLLDWETDRLTCAYSSGLSPEYVTRIDHTHRDSPGSHILSFSEPIHVLDAQTDPASEAMREAIVGEGYHTFAVLPLVSKGKAVGALAIYRDTIRAFTPEVLALAQSFANQAAVAIQNARLYQEVQQRVEELTFLNRGGRAVTSSLDLKQILATVTEETALVLKAEACSILLLDEESSGLVFEAAYGPQSEKVKGLRLPLDQGIAGWVSREGQRCLVPDVREDPRFYVGIDEITGFVTSSVLAAPLKLKGKVIGLIEAVNKTEGNFNQADIALLSSIAQWAAIAIENARLYQQTDEKLQTRVRELAALYSVAEMVNHSDLDTVLQLALDSAIRVTGMDSGGIMLLDPSTDEFFLKAHRAGSPQFIRAVDYARADEGLMPRMLKTAVVIDDLSEVTKERREAIEQEGIQSLVSVPLKAQESSLGVMVIASYSSHAFASEELELLTAIANQVGVAVDRANLQAQELRAAILEERQHMARQMHDDIAQTLSYLGLRVDSVMGSSSLVQNAEVQTELEGIRGAIEDTYERVRSSIMRLQEDIPDRFDWGTALQAIISEFEKQSRCKVESKVAGEQLPFLSPPVAFQAIYIIGEALANVRKHSGADSVHLTLRGLEEGRVEVTIQDNGQGFDLDSEQQSSGRGFGLRFMRERAERVGGSLKVESEPGQGTRVIVSLPLG